ncbi:MAG: hypothetical protein GY832_04735 [Chloroflexi bacterium]|nr:hypothetical protein [Chloroflexota bacterium]
MWGFGGGGMGQGQLFLGAFPVIGEDVEGDLFAGAEREFGRTGTMLG